MNAGSNAYDLSRFEARKKEEKPKLKAVKNNKQQQAVLFRITPVKAVFLAVIIVTISAYMIYTRVMLTEVGSQINRVNKEIRVLESEQVRLGVELEAMMSLRNIEDRAMALGMSKLDQYQIECIKVNDSDKVEVAVDDRNWLVKLKDDIVLFFKGL